MSNSNSLPLPVTVSHLPVMRCQIRHHIVVYLPGKASEVLTEHYRQAHPERTVGSAAAAVWGRRPVVASAGGSAHNPAWYHNIAAHPDQVWIEFGGRRAVPVIWLSRAG